MKYLCLFLITLGITVSCEKDIENVGVNLVDNNAFETESISDFDFNSANKNIENVIANNLGTYLLGVYSDKEFGELKASFVSQVSLPYVGETYENTYGDESAIDSVLLSIPYPSTLDTVVGGINQYSIDNFIGNENNEFQLDVFELKTFLNTLNPENPAESAIYYSDKEFLKGDSFYSDTFKLNSNDTVAYIKRYLADGITSYDIDTIKQDNLSPTIKIPLNESLIQQLFIDKAGDSEFESQESFTGFFRGLYVQASSLGNNSHLMSLDLTSAKISVYYSKTLDETEDQDLDGDGVKGETGVRVKKTNTYTLSGVKSSIYERDYTSSKESGMDRLYVQGASGEVSSIELNITDTELEDLRNQNLLITEANITVYVDYNEANSDITPERLFIYNFDETTQITDYITEGESVVGGLLEYDDDDKPYKYVFKITDYISNLLDSSDPADLVTFGIKTYNTTDTPTSSVNTTINNYNWNPKGVVLFNENGDSNGDKKIELEIFYTKLN
ncbi:DUF4270 domain-containing protein [Lutibacter oricola]|nr:DUF4270 domain-containing protein [Lutibacter oricola]